MERKYLTAILSLIKKDELAQIDKIYVIGKLSEAARHGCFGLDLSDAVCCSYIDSISEFISEIEKIPAKDCSAVICLDAIDLDDVSAVWQNQLRVAFSDFALFFFRGTIVNDSEEIVKVFQAHRLPYGLIGEREVHGGACPVITGGWIQPEVVASDLKVAAIMHVYNEEDIIVESISHLLKNEVDVFVFDNWSDDGTYEKVTELSTQNPRVKISRFPVSRGTDIYNWKEQLEKTERVASELGYDWYIHYDADEIRVPFWGNISLRNAIALVDSKGFNAIDFTVIDFVFLEQQNYESGSFEEDLNSFRFGKRPGHFKQIKAWKSLGGVPLDISSTGGHEAIFNGRRVFPYKFLMKHYPLRSREQAEKKVFRDRKPRFAKEQKLYGWHGHYEHLKVAEDIKFDHLEVDVWCGQNAFYRKYLIEGLTGVGINEI
ncbi:glycosyltransferase family 2 protein [Bdellovibrio bacteriovorus]|uniref:glycosyltransferase family 2 protein n=1 Tax=Bdellovibrio bacteriovorus TaxID=959 RepID=UPI0035A73514